MNLNRTKGNHLCLLLDSRSRHILPHQPLHATIERQCTAPFRRDGGKGRRGNDMRERHSSFRRDQVDESVELVWSAKDTERYSTICVFYLQPVGVAVRITVNDEFVVG